MRMMQGKEKSPKLRAFRGSGDWIRTNDTPGMNFVRSNSHLLASLKKSPNLAFFCKNRFIAFQYF